MANLITVRLQRGDGQAWGFRLQGGKDFSAPLVLQRVNGGSVADQAGLMAGDALIKVNGTEVFNMRHKDAQDVIVAAGNSFELTVSRGGATWRPSVTPTGSLPSPSPSLPGNVTPVTRTSLAATPQEMKPIGSGHNTAAKPFAAVNGNDGQIKSIVNNQYNTPVGMYSDETIAETLSSQAEVLAGGVLGVNFKKNERVYSPANSEVYKLLHEQGDDPEPDSVYSNNFHYSVNKLESTSSHFYATQSHAIGGYATAGRLPVGSLTGGRPRGPSPLPPQMQGQVPRPPMPKPPMMQQPQPQRPAPQQGVPAQQGAPKVAFPPQPQPQQQQQPQPQQQAPPAPAPTSAFRPAPNTVPRAGIPPKVHNEGHKTGVQAISAALNAHANLNGRAQSPYGSNGTHTSLGPLSHSPSHSRSSSTTSSSGYCNSSSLSPVQSNKVSPLHSRTSSENELIDRSHSSNSNGSNASELSGNAYPVCPASPPLPPPPPPLTMEECTLQEPGPEVPPAPPQTDASAPLVFGANGLAAPAATADSEQTDGTVTQNDYGFYYQTMGGRVIRSVLPPGKNSTYKVNQNNITPKPFGAPLPVSPLAQVQPPASYPPVAGSVPTPFSAALVGAPPAQPAPMAAPAPAPMVAAPAPAPMAAPAMAPASVPTPQDGGTEQEPAENESEEKAEGEADDGARERSESPAPVFAWPPKPEVVDTIPTATPIYIPPPETQRVVIKPITVVPPMKVKEKSKTPPDDAAGQQQQQQQSKSAPELCHRQEETEQQHQEDEELSDSFGMTTTTTATTTTANSASSEEYRMYQTQCSQPIVTYYDTPQYELERPFSSGQRSAQASTGAMSDASYTHFVFRDPPPEEEEEVEEEEQVVQQPPEQQQQQAAATAAADPDRPPKRVEFVDYGRELERYVRAEQEKEARRRALEEEMAEAARRRTEEPPHYTLPAVPPTEPPQLPPSAIPNPTPKQWQSALVQALCVAPPDPIHLTADQIEQANFMRSRNEAYRREQEETKMRQLEALRRQVDALERRLGQQPEPEPAPLPVGPPLDVPRRGEVMARLLATSTARSQRFPPHYVPVVPLPAETQPYFPPPHSMEPIRSEKISAMRNESPFVEALKTAPYTPFQQFGREIPSQMEDLPVPSGRLSMMDALATASDRPYTPFSEVRFDRSSDVYQDMVREQPSVPVDPDRQCSAFANVGGNRTPKPFVPVVPEIREVPPEEPERGESSRRSSVVAVESVRRSSKVATAEEVRRASTVATAAAAVVESRRSSTATLESRQDSRRGSGGSGSADTAQATNPPAPKPTVTTGTAKEPLYPGHDAHPPEHYSLALRRETKSPLNHPAEIPPYQRKWFNLPTQNPPRTPEPEELRTNVPLAFVNTHSHTAALSKPVAKPPGRPVNKPPATPYTTIQNRNIPVVTGAAPELDAELAQYHSAHARLAHKGVIDRGQSFTPSLILTKHATSIPYYQHQLGFEEYFAEVKQFDGHTTPQPSRTKSPAFGPPPNPLKPHVPPSREGIPVESGLYLSMGKLHGVPWYANKDHVPADIQKKMQEQLHLEATQRFGRSSVVQQQQHQQQHQEVTHEQVTMSSSVTTEQQQQQQRMTREEASAERAIQSAQQVGNALIQKRTRFVEEHESSSRSQSVSRNAPSESSRYSSKIKEDEAPQKGFVAQQTRRFSGQDEALNLPPQPTEQEQKEQQQKEQQAEQAALIQQLQEEQQKRQIAPPKKAAPPAPIRHVEPPTPKPAPPPTTFPSTDLFSEEFVDHFPHISARKASVLLPPKPATRPDCVSPSSFKAQFNEFIIGAGPMPPLPPMREEDDGAEPDTRSDTQKLIQSWPPQLPPQLPPQPAAAPAAVAAPPANGAAPAGSQPASKPSSRSNSTAFLDFLNRPTLNPNTDRSTDRAGTNSFNKGRAACSTSAPNRGRGVMNKAVGPGGRVPLCGCCQQQIRGPFITALGRIWCPDHFICHNANCKRPLADIGFVEEKGDLYCEYCFEEFLAPLCSKCNGRVKGDCLNAIGKQFHPECFKCTYCGKQFGNSPFFLEEGDPYCEKDWNDLFTTKCFACGFPVEAGDKWVEALNNNYHSQCFNCTSCKKNLEGQSFFAKGGRPFCKNHAR
ncbi:PDZ and LIM domain protein Zasp isoform X1 [Anopheles gambiae]|uniref:PDZ and LIM domain protein Zasp isoform X1 n=2 Tax=Anopheles gambiae TaxID=7165 RepID=UPI002AC9958F|nr:PDZ and LIM domain protein Zasp isoform X1 [Anopheles gambiae]XP_061519742.1 PDZ and LIM domain protein Zasp isoform X1 [Anopheles gambiae]XP_061519743.1 PDZ and LIM domain protein Zasp isoform X1 [Anopheles gambiae]XP_061519744.1 PDZ and LIM domain protein Zasp isoform X1 [Anopheles gambiae]XP_061519745.1 PDZ and LIM domain protein Zasp isoform X1 [Anopheles gambiae]XP_061519746.1 PDZ and LIM domain protein Zasp isoform X1 [Anopheles gambiae]XP_061519747.1 PDZ and LIM domain protein Zasp 